MTLPRLDHSFGVVVHLAGNLDRIAAESFRGRCAERISASMISMARSFRRSRPSSRYQTDVARSRGSIGMPKAITNG